MKKKIFISIIFSLLLIGILAIFLFNVKREKIPEQNTVNNIENKENRIMNHQNENIPVNLIVNNKKFKAIFYNNSTGRDFISRLPMTLTMGELHTNEKYNYLDFDLKTNSYVPNTIKAGDIKLYGSNCLVVFYKSFKNSYNYTDLGYIEKVDLFISELGNGSVTITFQLDT